MTKVLITGFSGFVGQHCAREFRSRGFETLGLTDKAVVDPDILKSVDETITCDLLDPESIADLSLTGVTDVLNLAGIATNTGGDPEFVRRLNVDVHLNLYRHIARLGLKPRIIAVSSGAVYDASQPMPETEDSALKDPDSARAYEASKILMERAVTSEFQSLDIVIARPFNHIGPGQMPGFIVPDLALQIVTAMKENAPLMTGNLSTMRDYTDVRDVAQAYADLLEADNLKYRVYNICSGRVRSGEELLSMLVRGLNAPSSFEPEEDPEKMREGEANIICGSNKRLHSELGWAPKIPIEQTIEDFCKWYLGLS